MEDFERVRDSPERARSLLTVRAAISSARPSDAPRSFADSFTCSYWRARFVPFLTPRGGMVTSVVGPWRVGTRPVPGIAFRDVRLMFCLYLAVIAAGLAFYIVVGLTHH